MNRRGRRPEEPLKELGGLKKLSPAELQYMNLIWEHPNGIGSDEIYRQFSQPGGTKNSVLFHISQKGYVAQEQRGRHHVYTALVSKDDYQRAVMKQKFEQELNGGSLETLVAAFCGVDRLTDRQKQMLAVFLEEIKNDHSGQ